MHPQIKAITYALGEENLSHEDLCERFGVDVMEKVRSFSGIENRKIAGKDVCASDLAFIAAEKLFGSKKAKKEDIDLIIVATQSPDYLLPTTACILQDRLNLKKSCASFDINLGCSQYIYALATAVAWLKSSMVHHVLLLTCDTPSKTIHPKDKSSVSIFGDGASATYITNGEKESVLGFEFGTDGSGYEDLILPCSAFRNPPKAEDLDEFGDGQGNIRANVNLYVNGFKIFTFAYKAVYECVLNLLKKHNLSVDDIDLFVFHQAGEMIVSSCAKRLSIPKEKVFYNMKNIGNCGGSSVPIALADAINTGKIKKGMKVLICAFGVGLSWGASIIEF